MTAVAAPTEGVDTLAAWLTAYLAAPASAAKGSFTVPELLAVAGLPRNGPNASAMGRALRHSGLVVSKRKQGDIRQWAWFRPHLVAKHPAPSTAKRRMVMHQTTGNAAFLPGHTEGDRRFTTFDIGRVFSVPDTHLAPLPPVPAPNLDDLVDRAREAVQQTAERAAARHWAFYREGSLDILGRLSCAIAIHQIHAGHALDIPEARP
ncbi:hypothetical protein LJR118_000585 [Acidovorax sp. LjRoot118]|uniref:hypothetical protein n=1 Tax=Acidovorax sp. LjRoot118 TaxID=3342256 RepID=UPI003ECF3D16